MEEEPRAQEAMAFWSNLYRSIGYPVLITSAETSRSGFCSYKA